MLYIIIIIIIISSNHLVCISQHLSVEEEEWERKHLNPNRLDESKWINFLNENSKDNVERVRTNGKFTMHQNNNGYIYDNSIR